MFGKKEKAGRDVRAELKAKGCAVFGSGAAVAKVAQLLADEEIVHAFNAKVDDSLGYVVATPSRLIVVGAQAFKSTVEDVPLSKISSVQIEGGAHLAEAKFMIGSRELAVTNVSQVRVAELAKWLRERGDAPSAAPPPPVAADPADQLRKLAALRDDGIITDADFEAKKKELLGL